MADCNDCIEETNIPSVDNTPIECAELISALCVIIEEGYPYIGVSSGDTLKRTLDKLVDYIKIQDAKIDALEARIVALEP